MPISVYATGQASFANGSNQVMGTGTAWIGAGIREGDMFWADGLLVRVQAIVSNTEITLAHPWPGNTGVQSNYEIHYTHDGSRVLSKSVEILEKFQGNGVGALSALEPEPDMLPYFNGLQTADTTEFTSKARQLLALADNAAILNNLGILFQASRYDATTGRILKVGAFGLGSTIGQDITYLDSTGNFTSFATVTPATVTGTVPPLVGAKDGVLNIKISASIAVQIYFSTHASSPVYYRRSLGSTQWEDWREFSLV